MGWISIGDQELPRVGHQLASCSLLNSYVLLMFKHNYKISLPYIICSTFDYYLERVIDYIFLFVVFQLLGSSQKEYEKQVAEYSIKTQQRFRGNLGKYKKAGKYYKCLGCIKGLNLITRLIDKVRIWNRMVFCEEVYVFES